MSFVYHAFISGLQIRSMTQLDPSIWNPRSHSLTPWRHTIHLWSDGFTVEDGPYPHPHPHPHPHPNTNPNPNPNPNQALEPNTVLLDNALATMGAGLPAAIAAKIIEPSRQVRRARSG